MSKVKNLLSVLEPIEEDITLFGGEKFSTGIVVLPVLTKLKKRLAPDEKYPIYIVKLKKDIKDDKLKFLEDDKRAEVIIVKVKEELLKLQEDRSTEEVTLERQPPEKKRFLGVGLSDSESDEGERASWGAAEEINKYKQEKSNSSESWSGGGTGGQSIL